MFDVTCQTCYEVQEKYNSKLNKKQIHITYLSSFIPDFIASKSDFVTDRLNLADKTLQPFKPVLNG